MQQLLEFHLKQLKQLSSERSTVLVYKGFPIAFLRKLHKHIKHLDDLSFLTADDKLDLGALEKNFWALGIKLNQVKDTRTFILYEEFLLLPAHALPQINVDFIIVVNNFFDYYPNQSNLDFGDIEEAINSDIFYDSDKLFEKFYADSKILAEVNCIQFLDPQADQATQSFSIVNFFNPNDYALPKFETGDYKGTDAVQFLAADNAYLKLKFQIFNEQLPASVKLIVDENILHIDSDLDELKILAFILQNSRKQITFYRQPKKFESFFRPELTTLLKNHWGPQALFKNLMIYKDPDRNKEIVEISQGAIVEHIVRQYELASANAVFEDVFLTAPTGAGKSLLFQLPAIFLSELNDKKPITIVVSPLKSLMVDQVNAMKEDRKYPKVAFLNSDLSLIQRQDIIEQTNRSEINILYLSPELLLSYDIRVFIGDRDIGLLVVDEAHLVTTWGRDFRVDYWFLGNYIRKLRKSHLAKGDRPLKQYRFPVVALTATAVFNGQDDMVFETIGSLNMQTCRIYIGRIKRDEITFSYHKFETKEHTLDKVNKTAARIQQFLKEGKKSIFYFPWISQIDNLRLSLAKSSQNQIASYHAQLQAEERNFALLNFKHGDIKCVLATKAFGMGVDISDIEIVYHHAPSGALSDYVQEIGRLARKKNMKGTAVVDFNPKDLKFTRILFGLSSLKQFQVNLVLKKLNSLYHVKQSRNMLVSIEDFQYIFTKDANPEQKVKSALLVIEKDLLAKFGYNVLVVRPKSLFSIVFGSIAEDEYSSLKQGFGSYIQIIEKQKYAKAITALEGGGTLHRKKDSKKVFVKIFLDKLWEGHFAEESFPSVKYKFFNQQLLPGVEPLLKIQIHFKEKINVLWGKFDKSIELLEAALISFGGRYFKKEELFKSLNQKIDNVATCKKLADLLTVFYAERDGFGRNGGFDFNSNNFLQEKKKDNESRFRVVSNALVKVKSQMRKRFQIQFDGLDENAENYTSFIPAQSPRTRERLKLAYLMEILDLATYEVSGGELPQMFVRINDPQKIHSLARKDYVNNVVSGVERRHQNSVDIMTYFFQAKMNDSQRWQYIEEYFLGTDVPTMHSEGEIEEEITISE
jgi:ATP-dependent DNA helicase RecQ